MAKFSVDKIIVIFTVVSAALLQLIDTAIVNVSLTQMMGTLGASFLTFKGLFLYLGIFFIALISLLVMFKNRNEAVNTEENIEWSME